MSQLSRRQFLAGATATTTAVALAAPRVHAQKSGGTLRFVAQADLKILDPVWTTAYITRNHGYLVYDTLFGTDEQLRIKPQMVDRVVVSPDGMKYTFTLRDGLRWHDGHPVGQGAWFGWPDVPPLEKLIADWVRTTDPTRRKQFADEIQRLALAEVLYVPWGEWFQPTAFRKNVTGVLKFVAPLFWNVKTA